MGYLHEKNRKRGKWWVLWKVVIADNLGSKDVFVKKKSMLNVICQGKKLVIFSWIISRLGKWTPAIQVNLVSQRMLE